MGQPFRTESKLPVGAVKTYQISSPPATHSRPATCAEAGCGNHIYGWRTDIDESTEFGQRQAYYIRNQCGRRFAEDRNQAPGLTIFTFEPGQTCFYRLGEKGMDPVRPHWVPLGRPEIYLVHGGDWRANTGLMRRHASPTDWVEDFGEHQLKVRDQIEKG